MQLTDKTFSPRILALATKGTGTNEEDRLRILLSNISVEFLAFDKKAKKKSFCNVLRQVFRERPDLLVMEGTGLAGGLVCLLSRLAGRTRYVFSSGDAVGPFVAAHSFPVGPIFAVYERLLCRLSDGFIGWTPYLTGRALTFGAPRAVTACGFAPIPVPSSSVAAVPASPLDSSAANRDVRVIATGIRDHVREQLGIPSNAIVFGLAGALVWNPRRSYCYGLELIEALRKTARENVCVLIVGGGTGLERLKKIAADQIGKTVFFTGMVEASDVSKYLTTMDVASLPQSRDGVGMFRYTTKISEYAAAGLPIVTGRLPLAYDLDDGSIWRLPGHAPWSAEYVIAMTRLMDHLSPADLAAAKANVNRVRPEFDQQMQVYRITRFINDLLAELPKKQRSFATDTHVSTMVQSRIPQGGATP